MDKIAARLTTLAATLTDRDTEEGAVSLDQAAVTGGILIVAGLIIVGIKAAAPSFLAGIKVPGM